MKKEHVIHIITEPKAGGAEYLVRYLNENLYKYGISSEALFISNEKGVKLNENEYCLGLKSPRSILAAKHIRSFLKERLEISDKLIIHSHLTWPLYYVPLATLGINCKLIFTEHSTSNKRREIKLLKKFEKKVYDKYDEVICVSKGVRDSLIHWLSPINEQKIRVVYNGARFYKVKPWKKTLTGNGLNIVSIGSLTEQKGFEYSIKALTNIRPIVNKYTIVGEGPKRRELEELIKKLDLGDVVQLIGWQDSIEPYLHESDVSIIPSLREGFGLVAIEAMSAGLPIVASDVPGLNEILVNDKCPSILVEKKNPNEISRALTDIYRNIKDGFDYRQEAVRCANKYSLSKMVFEYSQVYNKIY